MHTIIVTPRFGDVDGLRHINNCRLPEWFESGRMPIYQVFQPELKFDNWDLIMARISVDYHAQMYLGHDIEIRTWIKHLGNSSIITYQEAWQAEVLGASGEAVIVHYDFEQKHSLPIPDELRATLLKYMLPESYPAYQERQP